MTSTMRFDRLENSTGTTGIDVTTIPTRSEVGLVPIIPSSVSVASGSGSYNTTTGVVTFSGVTDIRMENVFSSAYNYYRVILVSSGASVNMTVNMRFRVTGSDYTTANQAYAGLYWGYPGAVTNVGTTTGVACQIGWIEGAASSRNFTTIDIANPFNPVHTSYGSHSTSYVVSSFGGHVPTTTAYTGLTISSTSTPTFSGTIEVYGYK